MMSERKKGAILSYIQVVLSVAVSVIYVPVLLRYLGQSEYGLYQIVGSFFSYISVFESCMSTGVLRNYCNALGSQDKEAADVTLSMAKVIYRVMAALMAVAGVIVLFAFRSFYASSFTASELKESSAILLLLFANMMVTLLGSVYLTILTGHEKFTFLKVLAIIIQVAQPFFVILCVRKIPYAITVSTVIVVFNVLTVLMRYLYVTRKLKIRIVEKKRNRKVIGEIVGLSATILLGCIADQIFWKTDQVILGKMFSTAVVAVYSVGAQIYMIYMQFGTQIAGVFYPRVSVLYQEENGLQKVSDLFIRVGRATFFVILLVLSGFIIFGREFLLVWVGEGYEAAYWVAIIVMLPFSVDLAQNLGLCILQVKGQYGFRAKIYLLSALLNIITTVLFARRIGITGAALSTGISMFLTSGLIMNWFFQKRVGLNMIKFWKTTIGIISLAVLLTGAACFIKGMIWHDPVSVIQLGLGILLYTIVYGAVMFLFAADPAERELLQRLLKTRRKSRL